MIPLFSEITRKNANIHLKKEKKNRWCWWQAHCLAHSRGATNIWEMKKYINSKMEKGIFPFICEHCSECPFWNSVRGSHPSYEHINIYKLFWVRGKNVKSSSKGAVGDYIPIFIASGGQWVRNGSVEWGFQAIFLKGEDSGRR